MKHFAPIIAFIFLLSSCGSSGESVNIKKDSMALLKDSVQANPTNGELLSKLYQIQLKKGDSIAAINSLKRYLSKVPGDEQAGLELAWLLAYKKDSAALDITHWLAQSNKDQTASKALYIRAHYYGNIGKTDSALRLLNKVIEQNFQFIDAYIQKGIILYENNNFTKALNTFMLGLTIEPSNPDIYYWIGATHKAMGHQAEAMDWQKKYEALH